MGQAQRDELRGVGRLQLLHQEWLWHVEHGHQVTCEMDQWPQLQYTESCTIVRIRY